MSYTANTWKSGDIITAEKLNNLEQGTLAGQNSLWHVEMGFKGEAEKAKTALGVSDCDDNTMWIKTNLGASGNYKILVQDSDGNNVYTENTDSKYNTIYFTFETDNTGSPARQAIKAGTYYAYVLPADDSQEKEVEEAEQTKTDVSKAVAKAAYAVSQEAIKTTEGQSNSASTQEASSAKAANKSKASSK